jgi:hypothetical protein
MATLMPCEVNVLISAAESVSSGARVTSLTEDWRLEDPNIVDGEVEAVWKREALCAPFLVGCK